MGRFLAISTPRLRLVAASAGLEAAACARDGSLEQQLGASAAPDWPPQFAAEALGYWREPLERDPGLAGWTVWYWIEFVGDERRLVGYGGFVGAPKDGTVEIGYSVVDSAQGRGLASEACRALVAWASCDERVKRVIAHTLAEPGPSQRVLAKLGFQPVGAGAEAGTLRHELELG
jgi:RimJ/RimL family protein N-acetyltransferase